MSELEQRVHNLLARRNLDGVQWAECVRQWGFESPPAMGCLLALVREARNEPGLTTCCDQPGSNWSYWWQTDEGIGEECGFGSEAEALVAALEAAP